MRNIYDLTLKELEDYLVSIGEKSFRASQIYEGLYKKRLSSFDEITNISKELRTKLKEDFSDYKIKLLIKQKGEGVNKYLFELEDGNKIESVLMFHDYGTSICVSSQVGCNMSCAFCESGRLKKVRNLYAYEIVQQILQIEEDIKDRITHVVVMGIGEPFDNFENIKRFISVVTNNKMINIGQRHLTISTCGLVPKIYEFADMETGVNLAISLHAPNDEIRKKIMPIANAYSINEVIDAVKYYSNKTNRRVAMEYILLDGINDSVKCANELADLLNGVNAYVNLIPYNETSHIEYKASSEHQIKVFFDTLKQRGVDVTTRRRFGSKISAACGQLRSKEI